ncbi:hypothetical protein JCM10449v2_003432 [Rhodotorula kratochvilovae]
MPCTGKLDPSACEVCVGSNTTAQAAVFNNYCSLLPSDAFRPFSNQSTSASSGASQTATAVSPSASASGNSGEKGDYGFVGGAVAELSAVAVAALAV